VTRLRDARPDDQAAIRSVTLAAYAEYAAPLGALWNGYRANILATLADPGPAEQIVAVDEGTVVATVLLYPASPARPGVGGERPWPEVRLLAVGPAGRGQGVGAALMQECARRARAALMQECARRARAAGATALTLHTTPMMAAALRLYERLGFVRAPELDLRVAPSLTVHGYRLELG
jgi:predicted N-acetyltransferase YhbS